MFQEFPYMDDGRGLILAAAMTYLPKLCEFHLSTSVFESLLARSS